MSEEIKNAGISQYGNFINYYSFNSAEDRLSLMPTHIWSEISRDSGDTFLVLDIGCNAGNFTQLLYEFISKHTQKTVHILGIDLDGDLISRASEHNQFRHNVTYECLDIMNRTDTTFAGHLRTYGKETFDAVFCLSLTMWIHLNHGDSGLMEFLSKVNRLSRLLVIEPQPWKCYASAVRRMKRADKGFELFGELKIRNSVVNDIGKYLEADCGLQKVFVTVPTKWDRRIAFYVAKALDYSVKLF